MSKMQSKADFPYNL